MSVEFKSRDSQIYQNHTQIYLHFQLVKKVKEIILNIHSSNFSSATFIKKVTYHLFKNEKTL